MGAVASYTFTQRAGEPHDRGQLRDRHLHDHGLGRRRTARSAPSGAVVVNYGGRPGVHDRAGRLLPRRGRAGGRRLGGRGDELHVHERDGEPHDRRQLRDRHATRSPPRRARTARSRPSGAVAVNCGGDQAFTIAADPCYHIADVLVDGVSVGAVTSYTFTNVHGEPHDRGQLRDRHLHDHGLGGRRTAAISPSGAVAVNCGADQAFTITPDACYHVADVLVDGVLGGRGGELHVHERAGEPHDRGQLRAQHLHDHGLGGRGRLDQPERRRGGQLRRRPGVHDHAGRRATTIADVLVDGVSVGAVRELHVHERQANHTIAASFAIDTYTITASAGAGGSISPSGAVAVNCGADQAFTITPDACYHIADVLVDGVLGGGGGELHVHERAGEPHDRGQLRDQHLHDHGLGAAPTARSPRAARWSVNCGGGPGVHDHAGCLLPHRRRAGGRRLGGRGGELHVHERDGQPHDRGQLRDRHATRSRPRRAPDGCDQPDRAR